MARIRTIKPSFWGSKTVRRLSRDARLLVLGLISFADDDGRFLGSITAINGAVFPNDELPPARVRKWYQEIVDTKLIFEYEVEDVRYAVFPTWHEHQVINRYTPSQFPEPPVHCVPRGKRGAE